VYSSQPTDDSPQNLPKLTTIPIKHKKPSISLNNS
jgi:hypothetical protein